MTDQADTGPIREVEPTWTDGDLVLVAWIEDGGLSQWIGRIVDERMGEGGPKPHRIAGAAIRVLERGAEIGALHEQRDAMIWAAEKLQAERDSALAELAAARDQIAAELPCPCIRSCGHSGPHCCTHGYDMPGSHP